MDTVVARIKKNKIDLKIMNYKIIKSGDFVALDNVETFAKKVAFLRGSENISKDIALDTVHAMECGEFPWEFEKLTMRALWYYGSDTKYSLEEVWAW